MGMDVIIHFNTSRPDAAQLAAELNAERPGSAHLLQADLNQTDCQSIVDVAMQFNNRMDVLINNASVFYPTPVGAVDAAQWDEMMNVNLRAPLFLSRAAAPHLAREQGCIINLADIHAKRPLREHMLYSVSKAGLIMLTQSLAKELGPQIRVNAISPGAILWPERLSADERNAILASTVLKRAGQPDDIAKAARYLIEANYMTGQILVIDGGRTLFS